MRVLAGFKAKVQKMRRIVVPEAVMQVMEIKEGDVVVVSLEKTEA